MDTKKKLYLQRQYQQRLEVFFEMTTPLIPVEKSQIHKPTCTGIFSMHSLTRVCHVQEKHLQWCLKELLEELAYEPLVNTVLDGDLIQDEKPSREENSVRVTTLCSK